jgi:hypothetical protein
MEVLSRSDRFLQEEESELNSAAFSWMTAVEQKEAFSMKKAFCRFKMKSVTTESLVHSAFEKHHFLNHCFTRFREAIYRSKVMHFRRRKLLARIFYSWLDYNQTKPGQPVRDGSIVAACFKWISATLSDAAGVGRSIREDLDFNYSAQGRLLAATYPHLQPHIRACSSMHLPVSKVPLLLHAAAMLDAHSLQKHFHLWRRSIQTIKLCTELVKQQHLAFLLHTSFRSWSTLSVLNNFFTRKCLQQQHHFLKKWQIYMHTREQNYTVFQYCLDLSDASCKKRVLYTLKWMSVRSSEMRAVMHHAAEAKRRHTMVSSLRRWHRTIKYYKNIRHASHITSQRLCFSNTEVAFGIWLLNAARRIDMKRNANKLVIHRFYKLSRGAFDSWKNLSDESRRRRAEVDMEMKERAMAMHNKLVMLKTLRIMKVLNKAWVAWVTRFKCRKFCRPLVRYLNKLKTYSAFMKWNLIINLSQIANCMQKIWRGYAVRHLTHRNKTRYVHWILSGKLRTAMSFNASTTRMKALRHWKWYIRSSQHAKELYSQRVVQLRSLRVLYRSLAIQRRIRLANEHGHHFKKSKQLAHFFSAIKLSVLLQKHYWESDVYFIFKKKKHALTVLFLKRLSGRCGNLSTGRRLLTSTKLRKNVAKIEPSVVAFVKTRFFARWLAKTRAYRVNETRVLVLARQNLLFRALSRWRGYCDAVYTLNEKYNDDPPELFGHSHYTIRMKKKYMQLFRFRLLASRGRRLRNARTLSISNKHFRSKVLSKYCLRFRECVAVRHRQIRQIQRRYLRPMFKFWHREFRRNHYYSKRIFIMQVKIMRRISKNVFLAWRLYAMKAVRLDQLAQSVISQRMRSLKERMLDRWITAATEVVMQTKTGVIEDRLDDWIKVRAMRKWRRVFESFQALNRKTLRVTYYYWAKLVRDTKITRKAVQKAEFYHCLRKGTGGLRDWHYMTVVHRNLRLWEFESRKRMLIWKAKGMLQYWRKKSWWQGRRVLWSRTRVLHRVAEKRFQVSSRRNKVIKFSASISNFDASSSNFGASVAYQHSSLSDSVRGWVVPLRGPRTAAFRAPLAHEAMQMRALRLWKKRIMEDVNHRRFYLFQSCFTRWKKHTCILAAKRSAFMNRLQLFDRKLSLQHSFDCFRCVHARHNAEIQCREKSIFFHKRHFFQKWMTCFEVRKTSSKQLAVINRMIRQMSHKSGFYKVQLAFSTWRVHCRSSPNLNKADHMFLQVAWNSWRLNYRATRFFRRAWLQKCFAAWASRVDKVWRTRSCLTQMRHATMIVESR